MNARTGNQEMNIIKNVILSLILAAVLIVSGMSFTVPVIADDGDSSVPNPEFDLTDIGGRTVSTTNSGAEVKILIFGRVGCGNTQQTVDSISNSSWVSDSKFEVMFIEEGTASDEDMKQFVSDHCCDDITVCPTEDEYGADLMWAYYWHYNGYSSSCVTYPVIFYIDGNDNIRNMTTGAMSARNIITVCSEFYDFGPDSDIVPRMETLSIIATCGQTEARGMLTEMNARRTGSNGKTPWCWNEDNTETIDCSGLDGLIYDYDLEKIALQRAAEIALAYGHARPSGDSCFTAYNGYEAANGQMGENIAAVSTGYWSTEDVLDAWWEEENYYSGQGHRRNILNSGFKYVGIGHVCVNGIDYWTQEFSSIGGTADAVEANDTLSTFDIEFYQEDLQDDSVYSTTGELMIKQGESVELPDFVEKVIHDRSAFGISVTVENPYEWSITNTSVAEIKGGLIVGKAVGTTTLRREATYGGNPLEITVTVSDITPTMPDEPDNTWEDDNWENDNNDEPVDPADSSQPTGTTPSDSSQPSGTTPSDSSQPKETTPSDSSQPTYTTPSDSSQSSGTIPSGSLQPSGTSSSTRPSSVTPSSVPVENVVVDLPEVKISKPKAAKKAMTVKWKKVSKKNQKKIQGIEIQVSTDPGFQNIVKQTAAGKKKTSKKIKGLKPKTKYWVRIRAYRNDGAGKHVSAWKTKSVKVK